MAKDNWRLKWVPRKAAIGLAVIGSIMLLGGLYGVQVANHDSGETCLNLDPTPAPVSSQEQGTVGSFPLGIDCVFGGGGEPVEVVHVGGWGLTIDVYGGLLLAAAGATLLIVGRRPERSEQG
jgi:hypothetical protein